MLCDKAVIIIIIKNEKIRVTLCENAAGALLRMLCIVVTKGSLNLTVYDLHISFH